VSFWEAQFSGDFYIVHFNRQPGVADAVFDANAENFLRQLYVTRQWLEPAPPLEPGMALINAARRQAPPRGEPLMSDEELAVFVEAFEHAGFTGGINWYRNFSRNWSLLADVDERITVPALMIYGDYDMVPKFEALGDYVADLEVVSLPCGHWIQQELPDATNEALLDWLERRFPAP
jgi:pimeloyl-ACP methyl ester carboxylesterase